MGNSMCTCRRCCPCCQKDEEVKLSRNRVFTSIHNYNIRTLSDLNLKKGDVLEVIAENPHWLYVKRRTAKGTRNKGFVEEQGYVPRDFVKPLNSVEAEPWYFENVKRRTEAKRCLMRPENSEGAFLVWKCEENNHYYLSVKNEPHARHYKIKQGEPDKRFFLVSPKTFQSLPELVRFYSKENELCVKLSKPCVQLDLPVLPTLSFDSTWEIDRHSLTKLEKLGSGEFAEVWHGLWNKRVDVAIKEFRVVSPDIKTEIQIMKELHHERLLKLYAVCTVDEPVCIITELMKTGSLKDFLMSHKAKKDLEFSLMMDFAVQITEGMIYLEDKGIVHRDLRADNILLTDMQSCKIADFGLAQFTSLAGNHRFSSEVRVPIKWIAPEIFEDKPYTSKSDVWSFGILLTEIVTYGDDPYPGQDKLTCIRAIQRGSRMERPGGCPEALYDIMLLCWRSDPEDRPGFTELLEKLTALINEPVFELE